jgi:hypothetical protein
MLYTRVYGKEKELSRGNIKMFEKALRKRYEAQIETAKANIQVYRENPVGIGEHADIVDAVDEQITKMAEAEEKLEILRSYYLGDY